MPLTLLTAALCAPVGVHAEYVASDVLNCRAEPKPDSIVITKLAGGTPVTVKLTEQDWSLVDAGGTFCWVNFRFLSATPVRPAPRSTKPAAKPRGGVTIRPVITGPITRPARPDAAKPRARPSRQPLLQNRGACPCSGPNVCIGPRGGRYCITSGGNKRYGV
ncbi:SH3 domain-containing protein [Sphingopyxis sp. J-6]|uniref:SH3 domain-containing protein n=1 Tax=Sphingopyxis sp. J-6 TaxID=3122054 RepID=UPI0039844C47